MGASGWDYVVPFEPDPQSALTALCEATFAAGVYWWPYDDRPRPGTIEELLADEWVAEGGTSSIIDCPRIRLGVPEDDAGWLNWHIRGTVIPLSDAELERAVGTTRPTAAHREPLEAQADRARWTGRCTILYGADGQPENWYFWGHSGD